MLQITVRVKNSLWEKRALYGSYIPEINTYTGTVVPRPKWVGDDSFCLSTGERKFNFRIISKDDVVDGLLLSA